MPARYTRLLHGDQVAIGGRPWQVIVGYGHAPEHVSLFSPALATLISGDMVLPRISTNVSVFDYEPDANPLPLYLNSLDRYEGQIGRAHVRTPVTNAHLVFRILLEKKKTQTD